jgi:hypothetical protein
MSLREASHACPCPWWRTDENRGVGAGALGLLANALAAGLIRNDMGVKMEDEHVLLRNWPFWCHLLCADVPLQYLGF